MKRKNLTNSREISSKSVFNRIMPFDTRRINGPESSVDYRKFCGKVKKSKSNNRGQNRSKDDQHRALGKQDFHILSNTFVIC